ncbi:hypothetical protein GCM10022397_38050 [Flavivirga jejuensis]
MVVLLTLSTTAQTEAVKENAKKEVKDSMSQDKEVTKKNDWGVHFEVTLATRFIWRGLVLGDYPNIQPNVTFSNGGFFTGIWASYALSPAERGGASSSEVPVAENYKEIIPYVGYGGKVGENSNLTVMVLTHYNPNVGGFFDFNNTPEGGGAALTNRVELRTIYNVGKLDFFAGWDFINDPSDNSSLYLEMGYTFDFPKDIKIRPFISGVPNDNFYTTDGKADFTQVGWYTSKAFPIGKDINLALRADMVYNPNRDQFNAAFNATIKL